MKKLILAILALAVLTCFAGCEKPEPVIECHDTVENTDLLLNGDISATEFRTRYVFEFYGIHDFVLALVDEKALSDWMAQFENGERSLWELTLYNEVTELGIKEEALAKANEDAGKLFSDEQIASLYSGDIKKVNERFANPYALVHGGEIYTPDWLATHTSDDYIEKGLTKELLQEYLNKINIEELDLLYTAVSENVNEMGS